MKKQTLTTLLITILFMASLVWLTKSVAAVDPPVLITEVQTGFIDSAGVEYPRQEFIELTNTTGSAVNMTGWRLEYLSASHNGTTAPTQIIDTISGQISGNGHGIWEHDGYYPVAPDSIFGASDVSTSGFLAKSGGHIRLMNGTTMVDCVAWGSATTITGCDKVSAVAGPGYTLQRPTTNGLYAKSAGVANYKPATPQGGNMYSVSVTPPSLPPSVPPPTSSQPTCQGVQLNEILPNPSGEDTIGEFIEIYNPTDQSQSLHGCKIRTATKEYVFPEPATIQSHEYKTVYYAVSALQLGNSGGVVTLETITESTSVNYPALSDDEAWALVNGFWGLTKQPTPSLANVLVTESAPSSVSNEVETCPPGKFRNPATGRCKSNEEATVLVACNADQERNPETGRCRKLAIVATISCPVGQEKNPATNRCRKIETASAQKACEVGQERNPETGRCRKIATKTSGQVLGDKTASPRKGHLVIIGAVMIAIVGYGIYEYRQEISRLGRRIKRLITN